MAPPNDSSSSCSEGEWQTDTLPLPGSLLSPDNQHTPRLTGDDVQALHLVTEGVDGEGIGDDPFIGMRPIHGLLSCGAPSNWLSESPLSGTYTCSDLGGALSVDNHWESGNTSRFAGLQTCSASSLLERAGDARSAVYEEQAVAAATAVDNVAETAVEEDTAAWENAGEADEAAPVLVQSSVISLCAVGDETRLRAHLSRTRAQFHAQQPVENLASAAPQWPCLVAEISEEAAGPRSCMCVRGLQRCKVAIHAKGVCRGVDAT